MIFDPDKPNYTNYGLMGHILGHELLHAFDLGLRSYDKDGNWIDWWSQESTNNYFEKAQCIVDHYNNYTIKEIEMNVSIFRFFLNFIN